MDHRLEQVRRQLEERTGRHIVTRAEFMRDLHAAISQQRGYAAGKIGSSEKHWMYYPIFKSQALRKSQVAVYEKSLIFHALKQSGLFPPDPGFYLEFNRLYIESVKNLDCLGLFFDPIEMEAALVNFYRPQSKLIYYMDQEPDRSSPANDDNCYLPFFKDKKLLLVCPFAALLRARATPEIFEGVWSKIGKRWFYPASVEAIEFPYGFAGTTQRQYATALELMDQIVAEIRQRDFDIALIAAGGLAIPIAATIKRLGKVALSLGGHLQIVFGVLGKRWRDRADWQQAYYNDWWIDMPARYKPQEEDVCDSGAYW